MSVKELSFEGSFAKSIEHSKEKIVKKLELQLESNLYVSINIYIYIY